MKTGVLVGRNDPCPCGSGKKYKKCCLTAVQARMTPPRPAHRNGERLVFHQTPAEMVAAREQAALPTPHPQFKRPAAPSPNGGETIEATGGHPFWVISGEDLDKRPIPAHCPAEVPNAAISGRWVNAIDLRVGDILFTRDGRRVPVTNVSVRNVKTKVYNLQVAELENYAVGYAGILVHNTSGTPFDPASFAGRQAVTSPHLPAGVRPALVVDGQVYVARMHNVAWELAGRTGTVEFYGFAEIDAAGRVVRLIQ
jgi:hypothetical protein